MCLHTVDIVKIIRRRFIMTKKLISLLIVAAMLLSLAACGGKTTDTPAAPATPSTPSDTPAAPATPETPAAPAEEETTGKNVYYTYLTLDHPSLNFADTVEGTTETVATYCMDYLYRTYPDENGLNYHYICDLAAEEPQYMGDATWRIPLRQDAAFVDGTPINADTMIFTFQQAINPKMAPRMAQFAYRNVVGILNGEEYATQASTGVEVAWEDVGVKKVDDYTIELVLDSDEYTAEQVMQHLYTRNLVPIHQGMWEQCLSADGTTTTYGVDLDHFVTCGPYTFDVWNYDSIQIYNKRSDYHYLSDLFHYDSIEVRIVNDNNARVELWNQGLLDSYTPDGSNIDDYLDDPRLVTYGSALVYHIDINCKNPNNPVTDSINYRKAMYHAINRELIADKIFGHMYPAGTYINTQAGMFSKDGLTYRDSAQGTAIWDMIASESAEGYGTGYNPALAREYLLKAFEEKGLPAPTAENPLNIILAYDPSDGMWDPMSQFIQEDFKTVFEGMVTVEIRNYSGISTTAYKQQGDDGWDLSPNDWSTGSMRDYPHQCYKFFIDSYAGKPNNYIIPEFDEQYAVCEEIKNGDYNALLDATQKLEQIAYDDVLFIPIVQDVNRVCFSDRIALPVETYVPGFGWGECFGEVIE